MKVKNLISIFLALLIVFCSVMPFTVFAADSTEDDASFTQEEFESLEHIYADYVQSRATGLIVSHTLGIAKSGSNLLITGTTNGSSEVKKCGFTKVVVERRKDSSSGWSEYKQYNDLYSDSNYYKLSKSVAVGTGYQYRVTAVHYAKKSLFSTEKITVSTGTLTF